MATTSGARYAYGNHAWQPEVLADFSRGMVRDTARVAIPQGAVYDASDFLLHQPGVAQKRGGTAYYGPAMTGATYATQVCANPFQGSYLAIGDNGHLYDIATAVTTDLATLGTAFGGAQAPIVVPSSGATLVVFTAGNGTTAPKKWDGSAAANLGGSPPTAMFGTVYKQRLVLGNTLANPNRTFFSPVPSIESTWDTTNSWIDAEGLITGYASLANVLLVFRTNATERIIGAIPPPNSDMDRAKMWDIGAPNPRAIVVADGSCIFANSRGVYMTNGSTPISLTAQGGIDSYWQDLLDGEVFSTGGPPSLVLGLYRNFLFVTYLITRNSIGVGLMCHLPSRAWWRITNFDAMMYTARQGNFENLVYADGSTNRIVSLSGIFAPDAANKNDANGTAVTPTLELVPVGSGPGVKSYGFGRIDYDMRDADADNPTLAVTVKTGIEADTSVTPAESPLTETTALSRKRFTISRDAQAVTIRLAQTNASSQTEIYAVEVEQRPRSLVGEGVS